MSDGKDLIMALFGYYRDVQSVSTVQLGGKCSWLSTVRRKASVGCRPSTNHGIFDVVGL